MHFWQQYSFFASSHLWQAGLMLNQLWKNKEINGYKGLLNSIRLFPMDKISFLFIIKYPETSFDDKKVILKKCILNKRN